MSNSRNDGKKLEDIVALIEGIDLPPGFQTERRKPTYTESGIQSGELDILISGKIGSAPWTMLIECRDRPSDGAAPNSWIEQLIGRRDSRNIDKVIAVSSTGFSPAAIETGEKKGIVLRTFEDLTNQDILGGFPPFAPLVIGNADMTAIRVNFHKKGQPDYKPVLREKIGKNEQVIVVESTRQKISILDLWQIVVNEKTPCEGKPIGQIVKETVSLDESWCSQYKLELDSETFSILGIEFDADLTNTLSTMPLQLSGTYRDEAGEKLVDVAHWKGDSTDDYIREMWVIVEPKKSTENA